MIDVSSLPAIAAPLQQNIIEDPSFETGIENHWNVTTDCQVLWSQSDGAIPDDGGAYAINFWNDSAARGNTTMYYDAGIVPQGTYTFDFMLRGGGYMDGDFKVQIFGNGNVVKELDIIATDSYTKYELQDIVFSDKAKVRIVFTIKMSEGTNGGWAYMDLVNLQRVQ